MRILWLSHFVPYPPKGGMLQRSYHLVRGLARRHEVMLLSFNQHALLPTAPALQEAVTALSEFVSVEHVHDIPMSGSRIGRQWVALRALLTGKAYTLAWLESSHYAATVRAAIAKYRPQALHFDTVSLAPYRIEAGKLPCVLNHHNIESQMMLRRAEVEANSVKRRYFRTEGERIQRYEQQHCRDFNLHLTCSELDSERLRELSPGLRVAEVPNGVDLEYFNPQRSAAGTTPRSMIFAGGLSWYPNVTAVRFLIDEVWPRVSRRYADATLTIVGRNPPKWLQEAAQTDSRIRVTGFVDDVRPYIDAAAVYVCPIFDGGGTKLKILDAMAMAKPIVAHPIAIEGIDAFADRHLLTANDAEEFAQQVGRLFEDEPLRRSLGEHARALIERDYSFAQIGAKLCDLYDSLDGTTR